MFDLRMMPQAGGTDISLESKPSPRAVGSRLKLKSKCFVSALETKAICVLLVVYHQKCELIIIIYYSLRALYGHYTRGEAVKTLLHKF